MTPDPAAYLATALEHLARAKGSPAAVEMAEAMIAAAAATLINERGGRFAYQTIQQLADDVALQVIASRIDYCGRED